MVTIATVRGVLVAVLVVGAMSAAGPNVTYALFEDSHLGTSSVTAADDFPNNGGGGPTADAGGPYELYDDSTVQLDGTGSTGQGKMDSYSWQIVSGPGGLSGSSTSQSTYEPDDVQSETTVTVELTVTNGGQSDTDQTAITVKDADGGNQPPVARFTASSSGKSGNFDFDATSSSDPEGSSLTYDWDLDGDGNYELTNASPTQKKKISDQTDVTLRVTDDVGNTDTETKTLQ